MLVDTNIPTPYTLYYYLPALVMGLSALVLGSWKMLARQIGLLQNLALPSRFCPPSKNCWTSTYTPLALMTQRPGAQFAKNRLHLLERITKRCKFSGWRAVRLRYLEEAVDHKKTADKIDISVV